MQVARTARRLSASTVTGFQLCAAHRNASIGVQLLLSHEIEWQSGYIVDDGVADLRLMSLHDGSDVANAKATCQPAS